VLNDLKSRGVLDVYLFCTGGLCGMMEAIQAVYPRSRLQRCIVHQIRSSTRFVSWKDIKQVTADLKKIYTSYNIVTAKGTAASRVFCRLKAEAVEWENKWPDDTYLGLTRPKQSPSAVSLIRSIRFAQVVPSA